MFYVYMYFGPTSLFFFFKGKMRPIFILMTPNVLDANEHKHKKASFLFFS